MNKIELLLAFEGGMWEKEIVDCPKEVNRDSLDSVQDWIVKELYGKVKYREVILIAVYNTDPQSEFINDEEDDEGNWSPRGYNENE